MSENIDLHKNLDKMFEHYCPKPEATKMFFNRQMDKQTGVD
jgi:hypothetical protein